VGGSGTPALFSVALWWRLEAAQWRTAGPQSHRRSGRRSISADTCSSERPQPERALRSALEPPVRDYRHWPRPVHTGRSRRRGGRVSVSRWADPPFGHLRARRAGCSNIGQPDRAKPVGLFRSATYQFSSTILGRIECPRRCMVANFAAAAAVAAAARLVRMPSGLDRNSCCRSSRRWGWRGRGRFRRTSRQRSPPQRIWFSLMAPSPVRADDTRPDKIVSG
jgi:hypothetical protein